MKTFHYDPGLYAHEDGWSILEMARSYITITDCKWISVSRTSLDDDWYLIEVWLSSPRMLVKDILQGPFATVEDAIMILNLYGPLNKP